MATLERIRQKLEAFGHTPHAGRAHEGADMLKALFCEELGWGLPHGFTQRTLSLGAPVSRQVTAIPVAQMSGLPVYYVAWPDDKPPGKIARRAVQKALAPISAEHLVCYVASDRPQTGQPQGGAPAVAFTWARKRPDGKSELRTLPYEVGAPARTTIEQLAEMAFSLDELEAGEPPVTVVTDKLSAAFSVEAVTEQFFADYRRIFADLQQRLLDALPSQQRDLEAKVWAHDYAMQLLNRLMFLYFIQRKRWLGDNPRFLRSFWESYKASAQPADTFFERWLKVLFFEAFNNRFHGGYAQFPPDIAAALQMAPYLNGGLFRQNRLDTAYEVNLPDEFFEQVFDHFNGSTPGLFERYNFTIAESTPLDVEVAVDPEMIGKVYESLVNITFEGLTEEDLRGLAGIFYTPRVEIDLMCRLALVDALTNRLGAQYRALLYDAVFATEPDEKECADSALAECNLWPQLHEHLRSLTVCDPACGSGSFLVGMLLVLDDLQARANEQLGVEETPYERRRRIIGSQLYGVDVMDWAVHVAELRLWLQLAVETELQPAELKFRPLLPNLSFKIRQGDSLVQEIGGIHFGLHRQHLDIPVHLKGRLSQLKGKKLRFYQGEKELSEEALKHEELQLFREILQEKIHVLKKDIAALNHEITVLSQSGALPGLTDRSQERSPTAEATKQRARLEEKRSDLARFEQALRALRSVQDVPFVWDIAFVEIFEGDAGGFDIVIGNPPYVRQEKIAPPREREEDYAPDQWRQRKSAYKEKLQRSVAAAWPKFFRYTPGKGAARKLDGKSDLYIYFYLHGLSLLNPRGSFCFITSNSWLDVGYGADLQQFLLKHSHVKLVLDNEVKRSFAQADVNTVIVLLAPSDDSREWGLEETARFVMFKKPFAEVARAEVFKAIEAVAERQSTEAYRVTARPQRELLEEGLETDADEPEETTAQKRKSHGPLIKSARYLGNKWGGKYLRAPDIFFTILEKGKGKLVRLGDIAEVRFGIKTGANEFFYLEPTGGLAPQGYLHVRNSAGWEGEIEEEFLKPVIKSPRECRSILIKPEDLRYKIFMCHRDKPDLKASAALDYIRWGEAQGYHERPSCKGRPRWWDVGIREMPHGIVPCSFREVFIVYQNTGVFADKRLYDLMTDEVDVTLACLNASTFPLFVEMQTRNYGGGGGPIDATVYEIANVHILQPGYLGSAEKHELTRRFEEIRTRDIGSIFDEIHQPDRRALDEVVFDVLGLTAGEREAVYEAVVNLVRARLEKAQSV